MFVLIIIVQIILLLILVCCWLYFASMLISDLFGVPFVPTRNCSLEQIFDNIAFTKQDVFYDLGSGDGRLPFYINKRYGIKSVGIELNPLLYWFSQLKKNFTKNDKVNFFRKNFFDLNLSKATVIYLFLFPEVVNRLYPKFSKECKKGTIIISHGFKIKTLQKKLVNTLIAKPFSTYYYRL